MTAKKTAKKKPAPSHIKCAFEILADPITLVPHPRNPNTHSEKQIELLAKIINQTGFRAPIVISRQSGFIIKGHGRLAAAIKLKLETVPVDIQSYANEAEEWADMIADNKIAEMAVLDDDALAGLIRELQEVEDFDIEMTGFDMSELDKLLKGDVPPTEFPESNEDIETNHKCPKCGYQWS